MYSHLFPTALTFFLVIDALGNIPQYFALIKRFDKSKQWKIALRELIFAFLIMLFFLFFGQYVLSLLGISKSTVQISGGILLFIIAIRLIFSSDEEKSKWGEQTPFIVPIATPLIASPSLLASIMIFAQEIPSKSILVLAIFLAWLASSILFLFAKPILRIIKEKGLMACQRLMGLIVAIIATQMLLMGILELFI